MLTSSVSLPLEILYAANNAAQRDQRGSLKLRVQTISTYRKTVRTQAGLTLVADANFRRAQPADLILLPTFWRNPVRGVRKAEPILAWLRAAAADGSQICTVSTGSFLLAEAGLLDGRAATTHWFYMDAFARRYPNVNLQRHHLITKADNIFCAGSLNSIADLMVYFVSLHFGEAIGRQVESQFSPEIRRPYRERLYIEGQSDLHHDETVAAIQDSINARSSEKLSIDALARDHHINLRSLNRRFKEVTGVSPLNYLQQKRISNACELLLQTDMSVADIALTVGYEDASYFSSLFKRQMQMPPQRYRKSVRGKLFSIV